VKFFKKERSLSKKIGSLVKRRGVWQEERKFGKKERSLARRRKV